MGPKHASDNGDAVSDAPDVGVLEPNRNMDATLGISNVQVDSNRTTIIAENCSYPPQTEPPPLLSNIMLMDYAAEQQEDEETGDHDLDALAEIVPGLISAMQTRSRADTSEPANEEELWRVTQTNNNLEFDNNNNANGDTSKTVSNLPPHPEDSDSNKESLEMSTTRNANAEVAAAATEEENSPLDEAMSSSSTTSGHAKPSKSTRALAEAISSESSEMEEAVGKKDGPKKIESLSSGFDSDSSESYDRKPEAAATTSSRKQQQRGGTAKRVPTAEDDVDLTAPKPPQPQSMLPMYLPCFKPATGCTNASDFIVRCFVARLRSGISVIKHGRSRWCKSVTRVLHIHSDGRSLSWKPPLGEPTSSKKPPKLDLSECKEVRHAWSPDPLHPLYTGTAILRQKCEAANAHKSFALIFPKRTVDVTAVTADQCKVLMEGFSALCFRLQVASLAGQIPGFTESMEHIFDNNNKGETDVTLSRSSVS